MCINRRPTSVPHTVVVVAANYSFSTMAQFVAGCYKYVTTQESADFWAKCGMDKEEAQKFVGTHWKFTVKPLDEAHKTVFWRSECEECPAMNETHISQEGKEQCKDMPMIGKMKV